MQHPEQGARIKKLALELSLLWELCGHAGLNPNQPRSLRGGSRHHRREIRRLPAEHEVPAQRPRLAQLAPTLDLGIVDAIRRQAVRVVAPISRLDGDGVRLADGSRVEADVVLAATGFRSGLEPLVGHLGVLDDRGDPVVRGAADHPRALGRFFVGYEVVLGGALRSAGIEAKQLARRLAPITTLGRGNHRMAL